MDWEKRDKVKSVKGFWEETAVNDHRLYGQRRRNQDDRIKKSCQNGSHARIDGDARPGTNNNGYRESGASRNHQEQDIRLKNS